MDMATQKEIDTVVKTIADSGLVSKIILFGSLARGDATPDSDIDLCALTQITNRRTIDITIDLRRRLWGVKTMPLDLLTYREASFDKRATVWNSFEGIIRREGVVVYDGARES